MGVNETGQDRTISERQRKALLAVIAAKSITEGTKKAKVSRTQFYEWLKDPLFQSQFQEQRQMVIEEAMHELKVSAGKAVTVLRKLLDADQEGIRLKAAKAIIDHIIKVDQLEEIRSRLDELEKKS